MAASARDVDALCAVRSRATKWLARLEYVGREKEERNVCARYNESQGSLREAERTTDQSVHREKKFDSLVYARPVTSYHRVPGRLVKTSWRTHCASRTSSLFL